MQIVRMDKMAVFWEVLKKCCFLGLFTKNNSQNSQPSFTSVLLKRKSFSTNLSQAFPDYCQKVNKIIPHTWKTFTNFLLRTTAKEEVKMVGKVANLKLEDLEFLNEGHVKMKDPKRVEFMLNDMVDGGIGKLQVVTDFDYTITKQKMDNGESVLTSFGMFNKCKSLPQSYIDESRRLFHKYRPVEIDPCIPMEEKIPAMIEWWALSGEILKGFQLPPQEIIDVASHYKNGVRDGTHEMFRQLDEDNIPCLVFSAGLGDCVVSVLKHANILLPNVKVVSNFLQYKDDNELNGLGHPMIHTYNKNETALEGTDYYQLVRARDHIIVMGDSLGDAKMANGVPSQSHVLKIGFLFDHPEENLPAYMDAFDIVLVDDQTMQVPRAILNLVRDKNQN